MNVHKNKNTCIRKVQMLLASSRSRSTKDLGTHIQSRGALVEAA